MVAINVDSRSIRYARNLWWQLANSLTKNLPAGLDHGAKFGQKGNPVANKDILFMITGK